MKRIGSWKLSVGCVSLLILGAGGAVAQKRQVLPAPPATLIKTLPRPLTGWKVIRSTADSHFMLWVQTTAIRMFEEIPKPPKSGAPATPTELLATLKVSITDTGYHSSMTAPFANLEVGKTGPVERLRIASYPAIAISLGESGERIQILVEGRFLVEYLFQGMGREDLKPWIAGANFSQFASVPDGGKRLKRIVQVTRVDELNPARNRTYALGITTTAEIEAILKEQEQLDETCPE